jgi:methionyl-tRNA synthetase
LIDRANSDLASGLGNLSSRTLTMIARYCDSRFRRGDSGRQVAAGEAHRRRY